MVGKCGAQIFGCVTDTTCKAALDCLSACEFNDQVRLDCKRSFPFPDQLTSLGTNLHGRPAVLFRFPS